ncbi:uncharacterized protein LOC131151162 [Malania oleifera]|uniref:uncharacterized protein LOC131151162 n=1 Tax=Malania oleifera TaxID=397392 RepID=UPI0025ADB026|nr:uncharacterized protein LOC131151162 [Malania oleifera]
MEDLGEAKKILGIEICRDRFQYINWSSSHEAKLTSVQLASVAASIRVDLCERKKLMGGGQLRRLPHTFSRVLELPLKSTADVSIEESSDCFRFIAAASAIGNVSAHVTEAISGFTKILIIGSNVLELSWDDLEIDKWRFRLPPSARPEMVTTSHVDGKLIVIVPKSVKGGLREGLARPILVK